MKLVNFVILLKTISLEERQTIFGIDDQYLIFILTENLLLAIKFLFRTIIPDKPDWVTIAEENIEYEEEKK